MCSLSYTQRLPLLCDSWVFAIHPSTCPRTATPYPTTGVIVFVYARGLKNSTVTSHTETPKAIRTRPSDGTAHAPRYAIYGPLSSPLLPPPSLIHSLPLSLHFFLSAFHFYILYFFLRYTAHIHTILNRLIISYLHLRCTTGHRCHITHRAPHLQTHFFGLVDPHI